MGNPLRDMDKQQLLLEQITRVNVSAEANGITPLNLGPLARMALPAAMHKVHDKNNEVIVALGGTPIPWGGPLKDPATAAAVLDAGLDYADTLSETDVVSEWLLELDFENGIYRSAADGDQAVTFFLPGVTIGGGRLTEACVGSAAVVAIIAAPHTLVIDFDTNDVNLNDTLVHWLNNGTSDEHALYIYDGQGEIYSADGNDYYSGALVSGRNKIAATINGAVLSNSTNGNTSVGGTDIVVTPTVFQVDGRVGGASAIRSIRVKAPVDAAAEAVLSTVA